MNLSDILKTASDLPPPEAAAHYAAAGLPVFPVNPKTKAPTVKGGFHSATVDPDTVRDWWKEWPAAMIGTPTGERFAVFDLDGTEGPQAFFDLCRKAGDSEFLLRCHSRTPRGGFHFYTGPVPNLKSVAGELAESCDTRAAGGSIILPGSIRADGKAYTFNPGAFTDAPGWLVDLCRERGLVRDPNPPRPAPRGPVDFPPGIPPSTRALIESGTGEGNRNGKAFEISVQLRDERLTESEALALVEAFAARCNPPFPQSEARAAVLSAYKEPPREPARDPSKPPYTPPARTRQRNGTPDPVTVEADAPPVEAPDLWEADPVPLGGFQSVADPLPLDALPDAVRRMCEAVRDTYRQPPDLIAGCALGVLSIATRARFRVEIKRDHRTHTNLYFMAAVQVGTGKTPQLKAFSRPLEDWQREARPAWENELRQWKRRAALVDSRIKGIRRRCEKGDLQDLDMQDAEREIAALEDELGPAPPMPCAFTSDATSEALARIMAGNGGCAAVLSSEGRKMLSMAGGRYSKDGDLDLWLAGHAGDFCRIDRRGSEPVEIPHPTLAALLLTQPDSLADLGELPAMRESGFLARFLYICPEPIPSRYNVESVPEATARAWCDLVRRIMDYKPAQGPDGEPLPHLLKMTPEALDLWTAFHDGTHRRLADNRETMPLILQGWESKLPDHVARLAGLVRIVRHVETGEELHTLTAGDVRAALDLVPAFRSHAARAVEGMGANPETVRARKVWTWIQKNRAKLRDIREAEGLGAVEAVKGRDLERAGVAGIAKASEAGDVLDLLAGKGWLQAVDFKRAGTTAKPATLHYIRPE
ncbi:MAG: DUF3987 domain-containing protein [Kiritimatiellia bacterium]